MDNTLKTKVIHIKEAPSDFKGNPLYVYIGRPSMFGNPFAITATTSRSEVVALFREYFTEQIKYKDFQIEVEALRGKTLVCFCKPHACHGDVIASYLNKTMENKK